MTCAAVIVTFNRSKKLRNTLAAVCSQSYLLDLIIVVDNASTDDTPALCAELAAADPRIRVARLDKNIGGAGGFHRGFRIAFNSGADYVWALDDDAVPNPDCLEQLVDTYAAFVAKTRRRPSFACSLVRWTNGDLCEMNTPDPVWDWPRFYGPELRVTLARSCSFVSVLVPREMIERFGLPLKEYFIWFDDAEYTRRISAHYPGIVVLDSVIIHDIPENLGVNFSMITSSNVWKYAYGVRNEASFRHRDEGLRGYLTFAGNVARGMRRGKVPFRERWRIYGALARGFFFNPAIEYPCDPA